jgi:hypothetical protein
MTIKLCSCCLTKPVKRGNHLLCDWCYSPQCNGQDPAFRNIPTEEDALELMIRVTLMERVPPTPVKHFSRIDHSQEQLQAILDGG